MTAFVTANNIPSGTAELTLDELNQVAGGTFTINKMGLGLPAQQVYKSIGDVLDLINHLSAGK